MVSFAQFVFRLQSRSTIDSENGHRIGMVRLLMFRLRRACIALLQIDSINRRVIHKLLPHYYAVTLEPSFVKILFVHRFHANSICAITRRRSAFDSLACQCLVFKYICCYYLLMLFSLLRYSLTVFGYAGRLVTESLANLLQTHRFFFFFFFFLRRELPR
jgi:hypothetical protein